MPFPSIEDLYNISAPKWFAAIACIVVSILIAYYAIGWLRSLYNIRNNRRHAVGRLKALKERAPVERDQKSMPGQPLEIKEITQATCNDSNQEEDPKFFLEFLSESEDAANFTVDKAKELKRPPQPILPLPSGTMVRAIRKFSRIKMGTPGIVTGVAASDLWWSQPKYICTFADNLQVLALPKQIDPFNHGYSLEDLRQADIKVISSRHATLRAQKLLSRRR